jgi:DNA polymerase III subunit epsilon
MEELEGMARTLVESGEFTVIRRFRRRDRYNTPEGVATATALFVDVETTGLDARTDAIIELAAVPFTYSADGRVFEVGTAITFLEDPQRPIPEEVVKLTGIRDADVRGKRIDDTLVNAMVSGASLVIAHNAEFDRGFLERRLPAFAEMLWACSIRDIPWKSLGCSSGSLEYILYRNCAEFFDGHRAEEDCLAAIHALATAACDGSLPLRHLLEAATAPMVRLWAYGSPFESKDLLKGRRYRWHGGADGRQRSWYIDLPESLADAECAWLEQNVYAGRKAGWQRDVQPMTLRYSGR